MAECPFVSIVLINWNGQAHVAKCLDSLLSQTYPNYEVIVVDNGSTDGSVELLKGYLPRIKLILTEDNLGAAAGRNVGIREAGADFVALVDNDAVAHSEWLERLVEGTSLAPQADIASGPIYFSEPDDVIWSAGARIDMLSGISWHPAMFQRRFELTDDIDYFVSCALLVRKRVFDEIGLLDERFYLCFSEDIDFCLRAKQAGFRLKLVADAIVWHMVVMGEKRAQKAPRGRQHNKFKNNFKLLFKLWPLWYLPLTIALQLTLVPLARVVLSGYPFSHPIMAWRAFFAALVESRREGFLRAYSHDLRLCIRTLEGLSLLAKRLR